jgi:hypothetical protein
MTRFVSALLIVFAPAAARAADPYDDLLKLVPPSTNTLALVNVKAVYASPLAKLEKWAEDYNKRYRAGIGFVPADAEVVAVASDVNLSAMTRSHQIGLVRAGTVPTLRDMTERTGGTVDRVADRATVLSPTGVYFVPLTGQILSAVYPADRQATARWVRYAAAPQPAPLSPYLKKATAAVTGDRAITVALDLSDSADPNVVRRGLPGSPTMARHKDADLDRLARLVASAEGVTFGVTIGDGITARVRVDFGWDVTPFKTVARELFLEALDEHGVLITGMDTWAATYEEKAMTLSGSLSPADLRRVMSLFAFPGAADEDEPKVQAGEVSAAATKRYLAAVDALIADLRAVKDKPDYAKTATWNEKAADQIDHLRTRGVDKVAVDAARDVSRRLRAIAASLRGVPINVDALQNKAYYYTHSSVGVSVGWWGVRPVFTPNAGVDTNLPQIRREQQKVIDDDRKRRLEVWSEIDRALADARQKLEEKYKERF